MIGDQILVKIVLENRLADFLQLKKEYFDSDELKIFTFIHEHVEKYKKLPAWETLQETDALLIDIEEEPREPYAFYHDQLIERYLDRKLSVLGDFLRAGGSAEDRLGRISHLLEESNAARGDLQRELRTICDVGNEEVLPRIEAARTRDGLIGIPTGWPTLDATTKGFQGGDLYVVAARVKLGKSMTLIHMAKAANDAGYSPLVISMEMRAEQVARRHFAAKAHINMTALQTGRLSTPALDYFRETVSAKDDKPPYYLIEGQFKKDIADVHALIKTVRPDIVFIDGGYLLRMRSSNAKALWERVGDIAQELKNIASVNNIPVVVSFQFNREVKRDAKTAGFENIQLSDAISQLASVAIGLFEAKDQYAISSRYLRYIEILGGREGEWGSFHINWNWDLCDFSEYDPEKKLSLKVEEDFSYEASE